MKKSTVILAALYAVAFSLNISCSEHSGHDHARGEDADHPHDHDGKADHDHDHDHDQDHAHEKLVPGPNGGRLMTSVEPHLEFLVTEDRRVRVTAVDDDAKPIALGAQEVSAITGDRAAPTRLAFARDGASLLSDTALPEGNNFPIVVSIVAKPGAETVREKFNVNLKDCPTCDHKEYACICGHE